MPFQRTCNITSASLLSQDAYVITVDAGDIAYNAQPGQFIHIKCGDGTLLRRPISICDVSGNDLTFVFETRGEGTKWLSERKSGDTLDILGPLGNGFDTAGERVIVVGGGIGVPPMFYTAKCAPGDVTAVLGFRDFSKMVLVSAFDYICPEVYVTTDDGSYGTHGPVTVELETLLSKGGYDRVLACGPKVMLDAVAKLCKRFETPCQVSLEERMGCGIGACVVCACKTVKNGEEHMSHVCKDGPVFDAQEVVW